MKIAIPTSDRKILFKRTGQTKEFAIYSVSQGSYEFLEFRKNPHDHDHEEKKDHMHSHKEILETLDDCDAILVFTTGAHFRKDFDAANMPMYRTKESKLDSVIDTFTKDMLRHKRI